jgi:ribosomal-protein-alanine N-acetyltransferase
MILETERLFLREMTRDDYPALCQILQDPEVMYAYEGAFSDAEVEGWLEKQLKNYEEYGFGLWLAALKETGEVIGQCGLTMQNIEEKRVLEVGYQFRKAYWHHGYAAEAAIACKEYAFDRLGAHEVYSIIRDTNQPSQNVAKRNGMACVSRFVKHYRGVNMPHCVYCVKATPNKT